MMFTNKLVLCQYCEPFFDAMYMIKILAFHRAFELMHEIVQQPVAHGQFRLFLGRIEAVRRN